MRIPDPKAVTAEEAYLGYKAEIIEESELKPSLYEPDLHFDGWLAYWCGLTNTYPTDENENPEMLCDEEALVAYLSGVTDTYPEEIKDPYDVRITGYLRYLCSYRFGRPEYPVTNSEFYLSLLDAPHTSNETPSTDIELDTSEGKLIDVKAYGDTYQKTYNGKNLVYTRPRTDNGITFSYNSTDGVTTFSGTPTNTYAITVTNSTSIPAGTYTISIESPLPYNVGIGTRNASNVRTPTYIPAGNTSITLTRTEDIVGYDIYVSGMTIGTSVSTTSFKVQFEQGSTATSFEPYVGGIPSPNPDYPQNIQVVTGEQTVNVHGKNLFNVPSPYSIVGGGTDIKNLFVNYEIGKTYTISCGNVTKGGPNNPVVRIVGASTEYLSLAPNSSITFTMDSEITHIYTYSNGSNYVESVGKTSIVENLMIEEGSTATTYQPYQSHDYKVNLGKNLFDKDNANVVQGYFDGSVDSPTIIVVSGEKNRLVYIPCSPNTTYSMSVSSMSGLQQLQVGTTPQLPENGVSVKKLGNFVNAKLENKTTSNTAKYLVLRFQASGLNIEELLPTILEGLQIEIGSTATPYAPYFTPIELCKIGNYQDYIYKSGEDWYVHKEIGKVVLDGSEADWSSDTSAGYFRPNIGITGILNVGSVRVADVLSSHFTASTTNAIGIVFHNLARIYFYPQSSITTLADWKTWLNANNTSLYYPFATPTDTKITDSTLISQLEALAGADTYNEKTFIKVTANDPNLPALLKVEAYKY